MLAATFMADWCAELCARCESIKASKTMEIKASKPFCVERSSSSSSTLYNRYLFYIVITCRKLIEDVVKKERKYQNCRRTNTTNRSRYHFSLINFNEPPIIIQYSCKIFSTLVYRNINAASLFIVNIIYWCLNWTREKDQFNMHCVKTKTAWLIIQPRQMEYMTNSLMDIYIMYSFIEGFKTKGEINGAAICFDKIMNLIACCDKVWSQAKCERIFP